MTGDARRSAAAAGIPAASLFAQVHTLVGPKLARVEETIQSHLRSQFDPIDDAGRYLAQGSGKRLRPTLVLLSSGLVGYEGEHDVTLGAVFEFIHTATLVHDDIIDEAETRRGLPSANRVYGNQFTVLLGDYLYIHAMNMALAAREIRVIDVLAEATERMIEGEILGHHLRRRADVTEAQHLAIVERKTAWLFAACCRVPAILGHRGPEVEEALAGYGMALGLAFQLVDDLLDVTADEKTLGKPVGQDLCEGHLTLPWIDLLRTGTPREREAVLAALASGRLEALPFAELRAALERTGCLARTRALAEQYAEQARELVEGFAPGPYRDVLLELPLTILDRDR